ncbi:MAG: murein biosynthesis integral membrane protein MurJ [Candidatus Bipolaricaulota bacterium]|nr:murein biosynthesis integral membrane protein MurJ [Candidatus Bipolaricaulota bacterium]MDW8031666.1 murein biosynthesis integral membrane protein MurJ [Candidatus Bipolaricaulota bacterium]
MNLELSAHPTQRPSRDLSLLKNVLVISGSTALSRILGLVRDVAIAHLFGASRAYDAYLIAFMIPHLLRRLLAEGALSSAFIPLFTERLARDGPQGATRFANSVFTAALLFFPGLVLMGIVLAPFYVPFFADGFSADQLALTIRLTQITFPFIALVGLAALVMGVLNSYERFFAPAFAPVLFNLGMIATAFALAGFFAEPIYALAVGVLVGGLGQLLFQIPYLRDRWRYRPQLDLRDEGLYRLLKLILPSVVGLAIFQINSIVDNKLASRLAEGSISALQYAIRLFQLPLGLFVVSVGSVLLPRLAAHAAEKDTLAFVRTLRESVLFSLCILLPATAGLFALAGPIIQVLFEHGNFTREDTQLTVSALLNYLPGLIGYGGAYLLTRAFYALHDTRTPLFVGGAAVALNVLLDYILVGPMGVGGLALATSLAGIVQALTLLICLQRRLAPQPLLRDAEGRTAAKMLGAALVMGIATYLLTLWVSPLGEFCTVGLGVAFGVSFYSGLAWLGGFFMLRFKEKDSGIRGSL